MPAERFFTDLPLKKREKVLLEGEEAFHMVRVMRVRVGDDIELINGKGLLATATVLTAHKESVELSLNDVQSQPLPPPALILCIALPRFPRLEFIIEKGTELGTNAFWFFSGERSEKEALSDHQSTRLRHLAIAAIKQCGRLDLPEIALKPSLNKWSKPDGVLFFGDTRPQAPPLTPSAKHPVFFFSGPESGFSPSEIALLESWHAKGVSLHKNILRADTAPIVAAARLGI